MSEYDVDVKLYQATEHSAASITSDTGVSIAIINEVLGHTDIRTAQKYSHVDVLSLSQVFKAQKRNVAQRKF
jgi:site-specific recombinase XerD